MTTATTLTPPAATRRPTLAETDTAGRNLASLVFMLFVHIADCERDITPRELRNFNQVAGNASWATAFDLRAALERARADYQSLWSMYEAKTLTVNRHALADRIKSVCGHLPPDHVPLLQNELQQYVERLYPADAPALAGLAEPARAARIRMRDEVVELLSACQPSSLGATGGYETPAAKQEMRNQAAAEHQAGSADIWTGGKIRVRCVSVVEETPDVRTFTFAAVPSRSFTYKPGQFATIALPIAAQTVRRSYTISSSPSRPHLLSMTVKQQLEGLMSRHLFEHLTSGVEIDIDGPYGNFTCVDYPSDKLLLISAGSGITPVISMLRYLADTAPHTDIVFLNNIRTPADAIFERELLHLSAQLGPSLRLGIVPKTLRHGQGWNGLTGAISPHILTAYAPDFLERETFVCGPSAYMDTVREMLQALGYPMHRYHQEAFGPPSRATPRVLAAPPASAQSAPAAPGFTVTFERSEITMICPTGDTVLDAADRDGVALASSCRNGVCATCKVRLIRGTVEMEPTDALTANEIADGFILACVARPTSALVVDA